MGAFVLFKKGLDVSLVEEGKKVFHDKGFTSSTELSFGNWKAIVYKKQLVEVNNIRCFNHYTLVALGTPVYCGSNYSGSLDKIMHDLCDGQFSYSKMYGTYLLIFYDGNTIQLIHDDMQQYPLFFSADGTVVSSSFLVCSKMVSGNLTIDKLACLEKFCTGMITGSNTLFCEVKRLLNIDKPSCLEGIEWPGGCLAIDKRREGLTLEREAEKQLEVLNANVINIQSLVNEYGADMGLSGGFDSRLIYGLLARQLYNKLSVHSHQTKGAHEKEIAIAKQLAALYGLQLHTSKTKPLTEMDSDEIDHTITNNLFLFDGYSDSHYGTFSSTYSRRYRETVSAGHKVFFTGLSGEIYRNYRKISKSVTTKDFFNTYVFYCHYVSALKSNALRESLCAYVMKKAFAIMNMVEYSIMNPSAIRRYSALVRLPYKATCAAGAFNQLSFYDAPCTHKEVIAESMSADHVVGDDSELEAAMIQQLNKEFWKIPITKKDSAKIGNHSIKTRAIKWIFARLPLRVIRRRKLKNNYTTNGVKVLDHCSSLKRAYNEVKTMFKDSIDLDVMLYNKNSYQNTIYTCRTLYEFKDKIVKS